MILIEHVILIIQKYIWDTKGISISVFPDFTKPKEIKLFEKATNIAMDYYGY